MSKERGPNRPYPHHTLDEALIVARTIRDENAGKPMNRLLLADALGIKPSSTNYRDLLSSSLKYGLTEGTEKAAEVRLTNLGMAATSTDAADRERALRQAAAAPKLFGKFYETYDQAKVPSPGFIEKVLTTEFGLPAEHTLSCVDMLIQNGRRVGVIREISGSPHVLLDAEPTLLEPETNEVESDNEIVVGETDEAAGSEMGVAITPTVAQPERPKAIFLGHGQKREPLEKLQKMLASFQIPARVVVDEPNLGRPIPAKVKATMQECGSAILIFTKDERFLDDDGNEVWRPSENVVHELGAASYAYEDRVVIFKRRG